MSSRRLLPLALLCVAIPFLYALFPGSTSFIYDEPLLLMQALEFNAKGRPADIGLVGSLGYPYGPLPTWVYQVFLLMTHDPIAIMVLHVLLFMGVLAASVFALARMTGLWRWGGLAALCSPYVWLYARQLWDNPFNIPLGFLALACLAAFVRKPTGLRLFSLVMSTALMLLVHLMAIPFVAAMAAFLLWRHWPDLRRNAGPLVLAFLAFGTLSAPYAVKFIAGERLPAIDSPRPALLDIGIHLARSPRLLSGYGLDYFFATAAERAAGAPASYLYDAGLWSFAFRVASVLSMLGFILLGLARFRRPFFARSPAATSLTRFCLLVVCFHVIFTLMVARVGEPHYANAIFAPLAFLLWVAASDLVHRRPVYKAMACFHLASLVALVTLLACRIHATHGTRGPHFGAVLSDQFQAARALNRAPAGSTLDNRTSTLPHSLIGLRALDHGLPAAGPPLSFELRYADPDNPHSGQIGLHQKP